MVLTDAFVCHVSVGGVIACEYGPVNIVLGVATCTELVVCSLVGLFETVLRLTDGYLTDSSECASLDAIDL